MKGDDVILQQSRTQYDESKSEITSKFKHTTKSKKKHFTYCSSFQTPDHNMKIQNIDNIDNINIKSYRCGGKMR